MANTIFYSWQSDLPNKTNRSFIEEALEKAIAILGKDLKIQEALRDEGLLIDKDTKGVPGSPPIVEIIFNKISNCSIFVPDLTFIGKSENGRLIPNPNVLIEYGWALKEVTYSRIIPVMNTAFGEPDGENMPFDMRHLRHPIKYNLIESADKKVCEETKNKLADAFVEAIKLIINKCLSKEAGAEKIFKETPSTINPSTFLQPDEALFIKRGYRGSDEKIFLPDTARLFLRIIPTKEIDIIKTSKDAYDLANKNGLFAMTNDIRSSYSDRNTHGCVIWQEINSGINEFTQLFKNKEIWGVNCLIAKEKLPKAKEYGFGYFPCVFIENLFKKTLLNYMNFASQTLKLELPLRFIAGATNVRDYRMIVSDGGFVTSDGRVVDENIIYEDKINDYSQKPVEILMPFFKHIWKECGLDRPEKELL